MPGQVGNMSEPDLQLMLFPRSVGAPNLSHFGVKLETYVRMAKIPYKPVFGRKMSPKGKTPWIRYRGKAMGDTAFIIRFLNQELGVDLNKHLSEEQKAQTHAVTKLVEDSLYWTSVVSRMRNKSWLNKEVGLPKIAIWIFGRRVKKMTQAQGIGRHSYEEVLQIMEQDLKALSTLIGSKKFLMGDQACEADAAIFGQLSQLAYQEPDTPGMRMVKETYPNLWSYCEEMRVTFWPDWDQCITGGKKKK